jgi:hypothetical protein
MSDYIEYENTDMFPSARKHVNPTSRRSLKKPKAALSEHQEQVLIFKWAKLHENKWPCLKFMFGTLNGVRLNIGQAKKAKQSGNKRGVPDIILPYPNHGYHGLYIELKIKGNYATKEQKEYASYLNKNGYKAEVVYGHENAIGLLKEYLNK